jgi:hypothetical protein
MLKVMGIAAAMIATAAAAQAPNEGSTRVPSNNSDPNEVVCVYQQTTGSRVNRVRVCRTRQQWADTRQETRQTVERVQDSRTTKAE